MIKFISHSSHLKIKRSNVSDTEYKPTKNSLWKIYKSLGWLSEFYTTLLYVSDIDANSFVHFQLGHQIRRKINTLKKEEALFETIMKLCSMSFKKIKIWEGVASHKKVKTKYYYIKLYVKEHLSIIFSNICILLR